MEFDQSVWIGRWNNFERCIYSEAPAIALCWAEAEAAVRDMPLFPHGARRFWKMVCSTVDPETGTRLGGWEVEADRTGLRIIWIGEQGNLLAKRTYTLFSMIARGLDAKRNYLFEAAEQLQNDPFRYLLAGQPQNQDCAVRYLQFQYAGHVEELLQDGKLRRPMWYATMYEADADLLAQCNMIRALHQLPRWDALPQIEESPKQRLSRAQRALAHAVRVYLTEHLHTRITIDELAKQFGVSPTQLKTSFRGVYGVSVQTFQREQKIHVAASLLRTTDRTVLDIASEFGYANGSKFAAAFQRVMGMTPNEYRTK